MWSMCTWQMAVQTAAHSAPLVSAHPAAPGSPASDAFVASSAASAGGGCRLLATAERSCCRAAGTPGPLCCSCWQDPEASSLQQEQAGGDNHRTSAACLCSRLKSQLLHMRIAPLHVPRCSIHNEFVIFTGMCRSTTLQHMARGNSLGICANHPLACMRKLGQHLAHQLLL